MSAFFETFVYEGICGWFGRIGVKTNTYRALRGLAARLATDDGVESFTVCGFWLFRQLEHMNCKDLCSYGMQADVRRFDVKDMAKAIST